MQYITKYLDLLTSLTAEMAPYLLLGFLLAGITHRFFPKEWIKSHLSGNGFIQSLKASIFGVPLPVCSCGIIPLAKELKKNGASNPGVASFLASTPQTGVDSIAATAGLMGGPFALLRVIVAFISGIVTGTLIGLLEKSGLKKSSPSDIPVGQDTKPSGGIVGILKYSLIELPSDIRNSLTLGLLVAALISLFLPDFSAVSSDQSTWLTYLGVMALAIPLYVCSTGSIPIAIALIASGLTPGAALIFLVAGPATNIVTIVTMGDIIGWRNTMLYLFSVIGIAWLSAAIVDSSFFTLELTEGLAHIHDHGITLFQWICLTVLVISLFYQPSRLFLLRTWKNIKNKNSRMVWKHYELDVTGIGCKKCAAKVTGIIEGIENHKEVSVDVETGKVRYQAEKLSKSLLTEKLAAEGYSVVDGHELA